MFKLTVDEDLDNDLLRGLRRENPNLDILRVQDAGLAGADDPVVLEWAAQEGRVLLTHDAHTMTRHAYERIEAGLWTPGIFVVSRTSAMGRVIEDILVVA